MLIRGFRKVDGMTDGCPTCGSYAIYFKTRDLKIGDWYVCQECGLMILFPLYYTKKFIAPVLSSELQPKHVVEEQMFDALKKVE